MSHATGIERDEATREALTRVLANEGRNALARVALAASELERATTSPAGRSRLDVIRDAVEEIDGLLDRIDGLAGLGRLPDVERECVDLFALVEPLFERLGSVLAARGVGLRVAPPDPVQRPALIAVAGGTIEAVLADWLRLLTAGLEPDHDVQVSIEAGPDEVAVVAYLPDASGASGGSADRAATLELDVSLAPLGARRESGFDAGGGLRSRIAWPRVPAGDA